MSFQVKDGGCGGDERTEGGGAARDRRRVRQKGLGGEGDVKRKEKKEKKGTYRVKMRAP